MQLRRPLMFVCAFLVMSAAAVPVSADPIPPPPQFRAIWPNGIDGGCYLYPSHINVSVYQTVSYQNDDELTRTVTQREGFWSFSAAPGEEVDLVMATAGLFAERCDDSSYSHHVGVKVSAVNRSRTPSFGVRWAIPTASSAYRYDVRYRIRGSDAFEPWFTGTVSRSAKFYGTAGTIYQFSARTHDTARGVSTPWSPVKTVRVADPS